MIREQPGVVVVVPTAAPISRRAPPLRWEPADPEIEKYNRSRFRPDALRITLSTVNGHRVVQIVPPHAWGKFPSLSP